MEPIADRIALVVVHGVLVLLAPLAILKQFWRSNRGVRISVTRGQESMGILSTIYGVATIACSLLVQAADAAHGYKAALILLDYVILTYLFFGNNWFRNFVLGVASASRVEDD